MSSRIDRELAMNALLMPVCRRQPKNTVMVHSDQGSQFSSYDWRDFLDAHNLQQSMSRRGNCQDNAVAESFFQLIKRERIRRKTYATRAEAREEALTDHHDTTANNSFGDHISSFSGPWWGRKCDGC